MKNKRYLLLIALILPILPGTSTIWAKTFDPPLSIGNLLYTENGTITTQRVLSNTGQTENSYSARGILNGTNVTNIATIDVTPSGPGAFLGIGKGVMMTRSGDTATWTSLGVAHVEQGNIVVIGLAIFNGGSSGELASVNNLPVVFKQVINESNNFTTEAWELR